MDMHKKALKGPHDGILFFDSKCIVIMQIQAVHIWTGMTSLSVRQAYRHV